MALYTIKNLTFHYPGGEPALNEISLTVEEGAFAVLVGPSGCGKTTLLRHFKPALTPFGEREGEILYKGAPLSELPPAEQAAQIGFVLQDPDSQIVTDKVWHELAFGLESLGMDTPTIRLRVAEMASFFGIEGWFRKPVAELSGGQKQLLNLASIMAMHPSALILDEPTSQLDPIAAGEFLSAVRRINRELGTTVIISEHRLEEAIPMADKIIALEGGKIVADGAPVEAAERLKRENPQIFLSMPAPMRIYAGLKTSLPCPLTVRDARRFISAVLGTRALTRIEDLPYTPPAPNPIFELKRVWFRYDRNSADVIRDLDLKVYPGEIYCLLGGNGTGKSTVLSLISGLRRPYRGKALMDGGDILGQGAKLYLNGIGALPQNPQCLFVKKTVLEDLMEAVSGPKKSEARARAREAAEVMGITNRLGAHPYDLSGGEQQRAAIAKVLLLKPRLLLLDEPTKGMDGWFKLEFGRILKEQAEKGASIVMVSHDIEFCAQVADRCGLLFDGAIAADSSPRAFFSGNSFYTTAANRAARHVIENAVSVEEVTKLCANISLGG